MAADLTLYTNPQSRGRIARWMLEEVGQPYDVELLGYGGTMKGEAFLAVNPMGKVPAIVHRGRVVTEAAAICAYLADAFPETGLQPTDEERADYWRWLFFAAGPVEHAVTNRHFGVSTEGKEMMAGYGSYDATMRTFERAVAAHPFIAGDRFTAADVYVGSAVLWGLQFGTVPKLAAFEEYAARLRERGAYARANELDDADAARMNAAA